MWSRLTRFILPRHQPLLSRESYTRELWSAGFFPIAGSLTEGAVISILAQQVFGIGAIAFAAIMAAPQFANMTSFMWARLARGVPKVRFVTWLRSLFLVIVAMIGLLPATELGGWTLVALVVVAHCLLSGIVTVRSIIWRNNYPRAIRGRLTGHMVLLASVAMTFTPWMVYNLLDLNADLFRLLYPVAALTSVIGVLAFHGIRLRRERELLRFERDDDDELALRYQPRGETQPHYSNERQPAQFRMGFFTILRQDRPFRRYMTWQMLAGLGNMSGEVAMVWYILQLTSKRPDAFGHGVFLTNTLPMMLALVTLPLWGRLLDGTGHIVRFRAWHSTSWIACQALALVALLSGQLWVWWLPRIAQGIVRGGGMLAWQLGQNDFARREHLSAYMSVHVTLTGIRGAIAPFLGMLMIAGYSGFELAGWSVRGWGGIGAGTFVVTTLLCVVAQLGYWSMARQLNRDGRIS